MNLLRGTLARRISRAGAALALLVSLAAEAGQTLRRPLETEPESLDPQQINSSSAIAVAADLFVGLLALDASGHTVPGLAERWEISADGKVWTFHLRQGLKWSDGTALTSADFVYGFRRLVDPATAAADPSDLAQVTGYDAIIAGKEKDAGRLGVEAPDLDTVVVRLTVPRLFFKCLLSDPQLYPLPRAAIEKWGKDWTRPEHIVLDGPFLLKSWTAQSEIVMVRNPNFYDADKVALGEVHWINAEDMDVAMRRFRNGEFDWMDCLRTTIDYCRSNLADRMHIALTNTLNFMVFNMAKGPLAADARVREALNLATDRDTIVNKIMRVDQRPAYSVTPPVIGDYTAPEMPFAATPMQARIAQAQALMRAAGYGPDKLLPLTIIYPTREATRLALVAVSQMWRQIYVDARLDNMEYQIYQNRLDTKDYEIGMMGSVGNYDDYEDGLDNFRSDAGQANWTGYHNARFDDLFHRGSQSLASAARRDLMQQAEAQLLSDYPVIPVSFDTRHRVMNPKLQGMVFSVVFPQSRYLSLAE